MPPLTGKKNGKISRFFCFPFHLGYRFSWLLNDLGLRQLNVSYKTILPEEDSHMKDRKRYRTVLGKKPLYLAVKVSFRVSREEIYKYLFDMYIFNPFCLLDSFVCVLKWSLL